MRKTSQAIKGLIRSKAKAKRIRLAKERRMTGNMWRAANSKPSRCKTWTANRYSQEQLDMLITC